VARARQAESKLASDLATEQTRANRKEGELAQSIKSLENNNKLALANTEQKVCAPLRQPACLHKSGPTTRDGQTCWPTQCPDRVRHTRQ